MPPSLCRMTYQRKTPPPPRTATTRQGEHGHDQADAPGGRMRGSVRPRPPLPPAPRPAAASAGRSTSVSAGAAVWPRRTGGGSHVPGGISRGPSLTAGGGTGWGRRGRRRGGGAADGRRLLPRRGGFGGRRFDGLRLDERNHVADRAGASAVGRRDAARPGRPVPPRVR